MQYHPQAGGTVSLTARSVHNAVSKSLKTLLHTVDAHYLQIDTQLNTSQPGKGLAAALAAAQVASGPEHIRRIEKELRSVDDLVAASVKQAAGLVQAADRYAAFLRSASNHIRSGTQLQYADSAPELVDQARLMRQVAMTGDVDGCAEEVASVLEQQADKAAAELVQASDTLRKIRCALRVAQYQHRAKVYSSLAAQAQRGGSNLSESDISTLVIKATVEGKAYAAWKRAYNSVFLKQTKPRRVSRLQCVDATRVVQTAKGFTIMGAE